MKELEADEITSSEDEVITFLASRVWTDMKAEIMRWREGLRDLLEDEKDDKETYRHQGRAEACKYFLSLPEVMKTDLETIRLMKEKGEKK